MGQLHAVDPLRAFVRPGTNAFTWLARIVQKLKRDDPYRPVTVIVPNDYAGRMIRWELTRRGGYVNVKTLRLDQVVSQVAPPTGGSRRQSLTGVLEDSAIRTALRQHGDAFGDIGQRSLHRALLDLFRELRRGEPDPASLTAVAPSRAARAALAVYGEFQQLTATYDDPTKRAARAARVLASATTVPTGLARLGALVLFLPTRLDPADVRFLAATARWVPLGAAFVDVSDPLGLGDEPSQDLAARLAASLGVDTPRPDQPTDSQLHADLRVLRAPDSAEEVREVVRCIAADLEQRVPLHHVAILYRQGQPYAALVRDALDAAGLPWSSSEGHRLNASRPGRCLLSLLRLPERKFAHEAVMEWLETGPLLDDPAAKIPVASWDRLSRAANVVRGADQWKDRLERYAAATEEKTRRREQDGDASAAVEAGRRRAADARVVASFVRILRQALEPPRDGSAWTEFVDWARLLRDHFVGAPGQWPEVERQFALAVESQLESLRVADLIESEAGPNLASFLAALEAALESERLPTGRLGVGVLVEPVGAVAGLAFERVYLLGMLEGNFPPSPPADPFFPVGAVDPLGRRSRQRARERQDFLIALATADGGAVTLCAPESDGNRAAFPSRWLFEVVERRFEKHLGASEFAALDPAKHPWLRVVRSARHGVSRAVAPADLEDRRLQQAAAWVRADRPLQLHPMAARSDLPLGRALGLDRERRSAALTRFDGNVSEMATSSRRLASIFDGGHVVSASAVQTWATCGFRYFLERVVGVEPTERPEESWTIDPLERGSLIHKVLKQFFRELTSQKRLRADERYLPNDTALIEQLAAKQFADSALSGVTGHPLAWENAKSAILADLRAFLAADEEWRLVQHLTPVYFEKPFGLATGDSWPSLDVELSPGLDRRPLRFAGVVDRVDIDEAAGRAFVFDYKTGSAAPYANLGKDPVAAGQHVQLALYSRVVQLNFPNLTSVRSAFWFISSRGEFKRQEMGGDERAAERRLDEVLGIIARGVRGGAFPQVPGALGERGFDNCRFCDYERVCPARRDGTWRRKQDDPLAALHRQLSMDGGLGGEDHESAGGNPG